MSINKFKPPYAIGSVPSLSGHANAYRWRSLPRLRRHRASKSQGSSERVLPWQVTMDQLIYASLSHTQGEDSIPGKRYICPTVIFFLPNLTSTCCCRGFSSNMPSLIITRAEKTSQTRRPGSARCRDLGTQHKYNISMGRSQNSCSFSRSWALSIKY